MPALGRPHSVHHPDATSAALATRGAALGIENTMTDRADVSRSAMLRAALADSTDLSQRLSFLNLCQADIQRLRDQLPVFEAMARDFVEAFYDHLFAFPETARFLDDPHLVQRLKQAQQDHFRTMFAAQWDENYVRQRRHVGQAHADRGVQPQFFLGAYNQFLHFYLGRICPEGRPITADDVERVRSLLKAVFLDIGLTLDAYFLQMTRDLQQALDLLWKLNNELRQFAQFTSHDLKTPLATVANLCEEVLDEFGAQIPPEARDMIASAQRTVYRMSTTIDELLSVSLREPHEEPSESTVDTEAVLHEALERVRPLLAKRNIQLVQSGPLPKVRAHRAQLREIFYNLLANAAKYIDKEPGRIEVSATTQGDECIVRVADNGPGIPPSEQQRIFAPFRRLSKHHHVAGSGLGLYFTKNLVEQQGGRIWVESQLDVGSCFYIALRAAAPTPAANNG
jgi:signal transduction histidine kinase